MNTTEQKNKIIAEFLGRNGKYNKLLYAFKNLDHNGQIWFNSTELRFHLDWNWLMTVVEKIESLQYFRKEVQFSINKYSVCIQTISKNSKVVLSDCIFSKWGTMGGTEKIKAVYNACLEFIEWYNKQQPEAVKDLFQFYEEQPEAVKSILAHFGDLEALTYEQCREMFLNLETIGYTFEFGLDAVPFNLRKILE